MAQVGVFQHKTLAGSEGITQDAQFSQRQARDIHACVNGFDELLHIEMTPPGDVDMLARLLCLGCQTNEDRQCCQNEIFHRRYSFGQYSFR